MSRDEVTPVPTWSVTGRDAAALAALGHLRCALVADCVDGLGLRPAVMQHHIRPIASGSRLAGYAVTVHVVEVDAPPSDVEDRYRRELDAVDQLSVGDVLVVSHARRAGPSPAHCDQCPAGRATTRGAS